MSSFEDSVPKDASLGVRLAKGAVWLVVMYCADRLLGLASMLVLARILVPEDFGVVAVAAAFIAVVDGLASLPANQAIIRLREAGRPVYDTAWTLAAIRGATIALVVAVAAPFVAAAMNEPRVVDVVLALALQPLLLGLQNPRFIDFDKRLDFSKAFTLEVATRAATVALTIVLALFVARSYWAIVAGTVGGAAVRICASYALKPYVPRFSLQRLRELFGFSAWLSGARLVSTLNLQADRFLVAGFTGTASVGVYYMGTALAQSLVASLTDPLTRGFYPAFSEISSDASRLKQHVLEASAVLMAVALPLGFGLALVATELVQVLLGPRWTATISILHVLLPVFALRALTAVTDPLVMALGTTRLLFYRACVMIVVRVTFISVGLTTVGLMGAAYGWALSSLFAVGIHLNLLTRSLHVAPLAPVTQAWRTWLSVAVMILCVLLLAHVMEGSVSPAVSLLVKILAGAISYTSAHALLWRMAGQPKGAESRVFAMLRSLKEASTRAP